MQNIITVSIQGITAFVAVAQSGSFTHAAEDLGSNESNVGKAVQRLESHLSTRLLQRTTRAVHLTEDGETYLKAALIALEGLRRRKRCWRRDGPNPWAGYGWIFRPVLVVF